MYVNDRLVKIECRDCAEEFLVSEYVLRKTSDKKWPGDGCHCPYCGSTNTSAMVWAGDHEGCMDFADDMGCLTISHKEAGPGEELKPFIVTDNTGRKEVIQALGEFHALDIYEKAHIKDDIEEAWVEGPGQKEGEA